MLQTLLVQFLSNGKANAKLAILVSLYCGEFVKNSMPLRTTQLRAVQQLATRPLRPVYLHFTFFEKSAKNPRIKGTRQVIFHCPTVNNHIGGLSPHIVNQCKVTM